MSLAFVALLGCTHGGEPQVPNGLPTTPHTASLDCRRGRITIRHVQVRPKHLDPYFQPLSVHYALDSTDNIISAWENKQRERFYSGSCMAGLAGLKPAVWRQPPDESFDITPGEHELFAVHELRLPVGGYPGAVKVRLSASHRFVAICNAVMSIEVAPIHSGSIPDLFVKGLRLRFDETIESIGLSVRSLMSYGARSNYSPNWSLSWLNGSLPP